MKQEDISVMTIAIVPLIGGIISLLFTMFLWYKVGLNPSDSLSDLTLSGNPIAGEGC